MSLQTTPLVPHRQLSDEMRHYLQNAISHLRNCNDPATTLLADSFQMLLNVDDREAARLLAHLAVDRLLA